MRFACSLAIGAAVVLTPSAIVSQSTVVFPAGFDKLEGYSSASSYSTGSFAYATSSASSRPFRSMLVMDLAATTKGKLSGLSYRRDSVSGQGKPVVGIEVELELTLATAKTTSATVSTTFADNVGTDAVVVIARKKLSLPVIPYTGGYPEPFAVKLPFDAGKSLAYDGSQGSLMLQVDSFDNNLYDTTTSTYNYLYLDRAYNTSSGNGISVGHGESYNPFVPPLDGYMTLTVSTAGNLEWYADIDNGLPGGVGVYVLSLDGLAPNLGLKLPDGSPWYLDLLKVIDVQSAVVSQSGEARFPASGTFQAPYSMSYAGIDLDCQMIVIDPKTFAIYTSNAYRRQVPDYQSGRNFAVDGVYKNGSTAFTSATGTGMSVGYTPVIELTLN
ncbi:MAG: hypothetical protein R3F30_15490 [Planctomycetota bacterium]